MSTPSSISPATTQQWFESLREEMSRFVIGQDAILEPLLLPLLCREHALIEAPAGSAKWTAIEMLGHCFGLSSLRFRCSADLTLDDIVGTGLWRSIWNASLVLAENVDRLPPKLQSVLHGAMSERLIPGAERLAVPDPFVVYATRYRPDDQTTEESTGEHSDDRYMLQINVPYPNYRDEFRMAAAKSGELSAVQQPRALLSHSELDAWRSLIPKIEAAPSVVNYAVRLVRATRVHEGENPDFVYEWVQRGAGPRAAHFLVLAAKARATFHGRDTALHDDIRRVALPVLRHRIVTNRNARTNGIDAGRVVLRLLNEIPPRVAGDDQIPEEGASLTYHDWVPVDELDT